MLKNELKSAIHEDYASYPLKKVEWFEHLFNPGLKLTTALRKCQYYKQYKWMKPVWLLYRLRYHSLCTKYGFDVPSSVKVGPGFTIHHPRGILINSHTIIGRDCVIHSGTKIGQNRANETPVIGDGVNIGVNACIIGAVHIGNGATVGAGAVVVKDVSANTVVAGNPAKPINARRE